MTKFLKISLVLLAVFISFAILYFVPPVNQRINWHLANLRTKIFYLLNPPDQITLSPHQQAEIDSIVSATMNALNNQEVFQLTVTETPSPMPTLTLEHLEGIQVTPTSFPPTLTPTSIPERVVLPGIRHEYQSFNNCGPANLAMALSYWGWEGDQRTTRNYLRPNEDDANVMPEEMVDFVNQNTSFKAVVRTGGTLDLLRQLIAGGYPVILEMGHQPENDWWMGHYVVVNGYDDLHEVMITQDSLIMADLSVPYHVFTQGDWRDFNRLFVVIYPPEKESELAQILGADFDRTQNLVRSLAYIEKEIPELSGRDLFFALFNKGTLLFHQGDPSTAAQVFDTAFSIYSTIKEDDRPWRVLWYRTEPYQAYYYNGDFNAVIELASSTLSMLSKRGLEESHYWRGLAYETIGEREKAMFDYQIAVTLRPTYELAILALERIN